MRALFRSMLFVVLVPVTLCLNPTSATMDAISQLQKDVASLKTQVNSQEQKFSALLSNILLKLVGFNTDFANVKSDIFKLQGDYQASMEDIRNFTKTLSSFEFRMEASENEIQGLQLNSTGCQDVYKYVNTSQVQMAEMKTSIDSIKDSVELNYQNISFVNSEISTLQRDVRYNGDFITATNLTLNSELMKLTHAQTMVPRNTTVKTGNASNIIAFDTEFTHQKQFHHDKNRPLIFTAVNYNAGSGYNVTSGIFTAPTTGLYLIWMNVAFSTTARAGSRIKIHTSSNVFSPLVQNDASDDAPSLKSKRILTGNSVKTYTEIRNILVPIQKGEKVWIAATNSLRSVVQGSAFGGLLIHAM